MFNVDILCKTAREGSYKLAAMSSQDKNKMLEVIANAIRSNATPILEANALDIANFNHANTAFLDRLTLNVARIESMCDGVIKLIALPDPIGEIVDSWTTESGLNISKVRAPLGVIGVIYEARPNVTVDVLALCIKTGNAVVLRGGSDAIHTNTVLFKIMTDALNSNGFGSDMAQFIGDTDRAATLELLKQGKYVDVIIPRGGDKLKELVLNNATMPVIASAGGNCHIYINESADLDIAERIVINAKIQRPTVCNACEQLVIDRKIASRAVPKLFNSLTAVGVKIKGDAECLKLCDNIELATDADYYEEHLSMLITVKIVDDINFAIEWINAHNTKHSDAIIASDAVAQAQFSREIDSGCIYINASTRFTDGFEFGFGAEIGISTQKLHARGPLGLRQLTSEKYVASGNGLTRK